MRGEATAAGSKRGAAAAVTAGVVVGAIEVVFLVSMAALIFAGDLSRHRSAGVTMMLLSATVVTLVVALAGRLPGMVALPQDTVVAIGALMAAGIAERLGGGPDVLSTVIAALAVATLLFGAFQLLLGGLNLGTIVRFVPYPVIGGFLAGTGWLLTRGAIGVLTASPAGIRDLPDLLAPEGLARWAPGLVFAVAVLAVLRRRSSVLVIPAAVLLATGIFYLVLALSGTGTGEARADGWLFASGEVGGLWPPRMVSAVTEADWVAVAAQAPQMGTMLLVGTIALLLNASGTELAVRRDVDLNAELRASGLANVAVGAAGGVGGYHSLSLSVLGIRMAGPSRLIGLAAAGVCAAALLGGPGALSLIPTTVLGGLLLYLGLGFLLEWVWEARRRLPVADYAILMLILVVIGGFGFLPGVTVGLIAAIVLFVLDSSRTDVVRYRLLGDTFASAVERPAALREALRREGHRIDVLVLQGFLFFGSANRLLEEVRAWGAGDEVEGPLFLVVDLRLVRGVDSSAAMTLEKIRLLAEAHEATLVLAGVEDRTRRRLEHHGLMAGPGVRFEPDLDRAVEWCEDALLGWMGLGGGGEPVDAIAAAFPEEIEVERLRPYLESIEVERGRRLFQQGEPSDDLYLVETATLSIELELNDGTVRRLRRLLPGTIVGEMGLYLETPRTTSVVVEEAGRVFRMSRASFEEMEREAPEVAAAFHRAVARLLAIRLGSLIGTLEDLLR